MSLLLPKFLTEDVAKCATQWVLDATINNPGMASSLSRQMCHIVILVPTMEGEAEWPIQAIKPHMLYRQSVGDPDDWPHNFDDIARDKALQLWQGRNDDRTDSMPHLLFTGDTPYWGGVKRRGIVVTCSGVQPYFDKMISGMIADMVVGLAHDAWMKSDNHEQGADFLT